MSAIVIKSEIDECEDVNPQLKEGGNSGGSGSAAAGGGGTAVASAGEKTQAALKVAKEAKQMHLRLKDQNLLMPQKQQPQPATFPAKQIAKRASSMKAEQLQIGTGDNVSHKRYRLQTTSCYGNQRKTPTSPPVLQYDQQQQQASNASKCGEIFVTNNARKWTFVCTFCQKTTRDIGEFVCHIKFKHMLEQYYEDEEYEGEENLTDQRDEQNDFFQDDCYDNHDQDVRYFFNHPTSKASLHTNEIIVKTQAISKSLDTKIPTITHVSSMAIAKTTKSLNLTSNEEYFDCTNYLDLNVHTEADELPNNGIKTKRQQNLKTMPQNNTLDANKQTEKNNLIVDLVDEENQNKNSNSGRYKNELFDYDMEEDDDGVELIKDENNDVEGIDDDNLLFLRSSSIEDAAADNVMVRSKGSSKKYRSHVRGKAYCNLCDKTFQYYSLYRNHMIKHSNITPYKCEYCSKAFKSKQAIRYHMNTHTKEVQYTCPLCPMTYGTENQFITHVLNHESDNCFPCMVCAKILKSDQAREEHLSTHTEERPFGCNYCNKRFRQKHHLSNHLKLHCQYRCDFCKAEFTSTQTQRRPYACASCEEYPEVRIQVEKQRSKSSINSSGEVNPLELNYEGGNMQDADNNTECVDLATDEDDDESETSTSVLGGSNGHNRVACQYCKSAFSSSSALNFHMRQKHSHILKEKF